MLRSLVLENPRDLDKVLPFALWAREVLLAYKDIPDATTGIPPYQMMYGRVCRGPLTILKESWCGERNNQVGIGRYF